MYKQAFYQISTGRGTVNLFEHLLHTSSEKRKYGINRIKIGIIIKQAIRLDLFIHVFPLHT